MNYLVGILAGAAAGVFIKEDSTAFTILADLVDLSVNIGHYLLFPLIFFSLPLAVLKLRNSGKMNKVLKQSFWLSILGTASLSIIGTFLAWSIPLERIPVIPEVMNNAPVMPKLLQLLAGSLKISSLHSFLNNPSFILPVLIPAFIIGWHMKFDPEVAAPTFNIFDSLSRIFYRANEYILYTMPVLLALLTAHVVARTKLVIDIQRFIPMVSILIITAIILICLVCPVIIRVVLKDKRPWLFLKRMFRAFLGALISGSPMFNYGNLVYNLKENLEIRRELAAIVAPIHLLLSRAGTAMISAFCMLMIIRSYSSLEITLFQASWTAFFSFIASYLSLNTPHRSVTLSLIILGSLYGRGLDEGWLILVPILPILTMLACLLDTASNTLLLILTNRKINPQ